METKYKDKRVRLPLKDLEDLQKLAHQQGTNAMIEARKAIKERIKRLLKYEEKTGEMFWIRIFSDNSGQILNYENELIRNFDDESELIDILTDLTK